MKKIGTVLFLGEQCDVLLTRYAVKPKSEKRASHCLKVTDEMGMPMATASVNMPDVYHPNEDEVIIKDWAENKGMYNALRASGIVGAIIKKIRAGYEEALVCELLKR